MSASTSPVTTDAPNAAIETPATTEPKPSSVSARIAEVVSHYVTHCFGVMGNGNAHFVDALADSPVEYVAVRHEVATVASADAFHRVSRRLAVATATYGAGFTNTLTALTDARIQRTPLLLVAGGAPLAGLRAWDVDNDRLGGALDVPVMTVSENDPGATTLAAIARAIEERTPVILSIPYDLAAAEAADENLVFPEFTAATPELDQERVQEIADRMIVAERPLIIAGRGARYAADELRQLADCLGAITVTSAPARGLFADRARDAGVCGGFSSEATQALVGKADAVLAIGASLNDFTMGFGNLLHGSADLIQIDLAEQATNSRVCTYLRADAKQAAAALVDVACEDIDCGHEGRWPELADQRTDGFQFDRDPGTGTASDGRLDPRTVFSELDRILPEDRLVVTDGGHFIGWPNTYFSLPSPDSIVMVGTAFQSIGLGFSSAPGAACAEPNRTLVVVTGDGGGLMALADLDSTVRASNRAVIVVVNDAAYNAEITQYGTIGLDEHAMRIDEVDFAALAPAVGAEGIVARTPEDLQQVAQWLESHDSGALIVDCRTSPEVVAPYQQEIMERLRRNLGIVEVN